MLTHRTLRLALFAGLGVVFVFGLVHLFQLRFEQGDIYPAYSSLRADPLGAKVFYQSLESLPGLSVDRLYEPLKKLVNPRAPTLFILGTEPEALLHVVPREVQELNQFMLDGGRLVIAFVPVAAQPRPVRQLDQKDAREKPSNRKEPPNSDPKTKRRKYQEDAETDFKLVSLAEKWNFKFKYEDLTIDKNGISEPVSVVRLETNGPLPHLLSWHTALCFDELGESWHRVYARGKSAVVIERAFGKGSLVLASDSYFASNEAMRQERQPDLLAWLVGANTRILFDETHLGVEADPGLAALARQYRLHGLIFGLVLLAALFVWKNASCFVPPIEESSALDQSEVVTGKDSAGGFNNLLRRSIAPAEILSVSLSEWKKSCTHGRQNLVPKVQEIEQLVRDEQARPPRERNPVQAYQRIAAILSNRKPT